MTFQFTPKQIEAQRLMGGSQRSTLLVGGARSGKTFIIMRAIITRALRAPFSRHAVFRFRYNAIRASVWLDTFPKVMRLCFPNMHWKDNRQDGYVEFQNGSQIYFCGLDEKERVEKILGMEFATLFFNEASQIPYSSYTVARTRLAQVAIDEITKAPLKQREYVDLNPVGKAHWTYAQYIRHNIPEARVPLPDPENYKMLYLNPKDNEANLDPASIQALASLPEKMRKRFFSGEYVEDIEGALWPLEVLESCRCEKADVPETLLRAVVAIDPSGTAGKDDKHSDDVGIIVAAKGIDGRAYVLADRTCNLSPMGWAGIAVDAYNEFNCDKIVAERNFGGAMVEATIRSVDKNVNYEEVVASRGKAQRAEPIAALYEKGLVRHAGRFTDLEDQLSAFSTNGYMGERSPDRADACVWAITDLLGNDTFDLNTWMQAYAMPGTEAYEDLVRAGVIKQQ